MDKSKVPRFLAHPVYTGPLVRQLHQLQSHQTWFEVLKQLAMNDAADELKCDHLIITNGDKTEADALANIAN